MARFYDAKNQRLVYVEKEATREFWDEVWSASPEGYKPEPRTGLRKWLKPILGEKLVPGTTRSYLPAGASILEGGCGQGHHVVDLAAAGYKPTGIDFAPETVEKLKTLFPELEFHLGDVRELPFESGSFDGYWSLGVIEHFWEGYDQIASEIARVLRPGGYLFLTFPYLSPLRRWKAQRDYFEPLNVEEEPNGFYQFALKASEVAARFEAKGLELVEQRGLSGFKGFKDEAGMLRPALQKIYESKSLLGRGVVRLLTPVLGPWAGHSVLLVFKR